MSPPTITAEDARRVLSYDRDTGVFKWRISPRFGINAGDVAGTITARGYVAIHFKGRIYKAHRLAVLYETGEWPTEQVDHRHGDGTNNRWSNLRPAGPVLNSQNRRRPTSHNAAGLLGAFKSRDKWVSKIVVDGKQRYLGTFATPESAHEAYVAAKRALHAGCTI